MKDHKNRMKDVFHLAIPREGTDEYKKIKEWHEKRIEQDPSIKQESKKRFKMAYNSLVAQDSSGAGFIPDVELRHFLREFNQRTWNHGILNLPMMFNVLEAFFSYNKDLIYFELFEEEDYLISFYDFIDFITSPSFDEDEVEIADYIPENLIYNISVGADLDEITFKTDKSEEFVVGGVSLIRRGTELVVLLHTGQICNTEEVTESLKDMEVREPGLGKENIKPDPKYKREAVKLLDNPKHWKKIAVCRFNLQDFKLETRYIASDVGTSYIIVTDDIQGFVDTNGLFFNKVIEESYRTSVSEIENYNPLFEVAKLACYLPFYLSKFEDEMISEEKNTKYNEVFNKPLAKRKMKDIPSRLRHTSKTLWLLNRKNKFSPDLIKLRDDKFVIETTGYWKNLEPGKVGTNKKGEKVTGKTWVNKRLSYFEAKADELIIEKKRKRFKGENSGYIYAVRNSSMEDNIFKVGRTERDVEIRKKELSNTSVPDKFHTMNEWEVYDCILAEKQIHDLLDEFRIDPRREFFKVPFEKIVEAVETVVKSINSTEDTT